MQSGVGSAGLVGEGWIADDDPRLDQRMKLGRLHEQFIGLRLCGDRGVVVVDDISLAPTGVEIVCKRGGLVADCQSRGLECDSMVAGSCADTVAGASNGDLSSL